MADNIVALGNNPWYSSVRPPGLHRACDDASDILACIYLAVLCTVPEVLYRWWQMPFSFGGTSLLIVVVVIDFVSQIHSSDTSAVCFAGQKGKGIWIY